MRYFTITSFLKITLQYKIYMETNKKAYRRWTTTRWANDSCNQCLVSRGGRKEAFAQRLAWESTNLSKVFVDWGARTKERGKDTILENGAPRDSRARRRPSRSWEAGRVGMYGGGWRGPNDEGGTWVPRLHPSGGRRDGPSRGLCSGLEQRQLAHGWNMCRGALYTTRLRLFLSGSS